MASGDLSKARRISFRRDSVFMPPLSRACGGKLGEETRLWLPAVLRCVTITAWPKSQLNPHRLPLELAVSFRGAVRGKPGLYFTRHALDRMKERGISEGEVFRTVRSPDVED